MTGTDSQRQLLTLIRGFASEKSQGERRVVGLKKQVDELKLELEVANAELEEAKRSRETTEQELKGYEVQLAMNDASIQALQARISTIQNDISLYGSKLEAVKKEDFDLREEFINKMFEFNSKIRKFLETMSCDSENKTSVGTSLKVGWEPVNVEVTEVNSKSLEDRLAYTLSKTIMGEEECQKEQNVKKLVLQELTDLEKKATMMEALMNTTNELEELTRQSSELEQIYASLCQELHNRCVCPRCHLDNVDALGGILQAYEARIICKLRYSVQNLLKVLLYIAHKKDPVNATITKKMELI